MRRFHNKMNWKFLFSTVYAGTIRVDSKMQTCGHSSNNQQKRHLNQQQQKQQCNENMEAGLNFNGKKPCLGKQM